LKPHSNYAEIILKNWGLRPLGDIDLTRFVTVMSTRKSRYVVRLMYADQAYAVARLLLAAGHSTIARRVPSIIPTLNGEFTVPADRKRRLIVCTFLFGSTPVEPTVKVANQLGALLARLHQVSPAVTDEQTPTGRDLASASWFQAMRTAAADHRATEIERDLTSKAIDTVKAIGSTYSSLQRILIHGDITTRNLTYNENGVGIFDFGGVISAPRLLDVQGALANIAGLAGALQPSLADSLIEGYSEVWPLPETEQALLKVAMVGDLARIMAWIRQSGSSRTREWIRTEKTYRLRLLQGLLSDFD